MTSAVWTLGALAMLAAPLPARAACDDLLPPAHLDRAPKRLVTPEALVSLRDVGFPDGLYVPTESPLALSPDGRRLAFVISRGDGMTNATCHGLAVIEVRAGAQPALVDRGGEPISMVAPYRGLLVNTGAVEVVTPVWSPDGRTLAYRKRVAGRTEAWIASADGSGARRIGLFDADVEALAWSADGARLLVLSRPGYAAQARQREREGRSGYLYDDRFQPNDDDRPALLAEAKPAVQSVEVATGTVGPLAAADAGRVPGDPSSWGPPPLSSISNSGRRAWLVAETSALLSPMDLHAEDDERREVACPGAACRGTIRALFWIGDAVVYLRREGWGDGRYALYRWTPGKGAPVQVFSGEDLVHGCTAGPTSLVCLVEGTDSPRRIVELNPVHGGRLTLFDPNPEFRDIRLGAVRRLEIRNAFGLEAWADLVLPPGYRGGRIPTVVVQYFSKGFLRGGTGDEYPVHAFAARGMAVLSIQRPVDVSMLDPKATSAVGLNAGSLRDWGERRSLLDVIDKAIDEAVRLGVTDPKRVGITGLSDGSTSAIYALINSDRFAAAAISASGLEPNTTMIYGGPRWAEFNRAIGYPDLGKDDPAFWNTISLARNAARVNVPLLVQAADREYLLSLEMWAKLKQAHYPVEMFVFPDEYHNKTQPEHRLAIYRRNLDWFDYWLAGKRDAEPAKAGQYRRWDELARLRDSRKSAAAAPGGS